MPRAALCLAAVGGLLGAFGITCNALGSEAMCAVIPGRPPMRLTTGIAALFAAIALILQHGERRGPVRRTSAGLLSATVGLLGMAVLAEYVLGVELGIDVRAVREPLHPHPGRPSPLTAATFAALGAALLLREVEHPRGVRIRAGFGVIAVFFSFVSLVGHALGAGPLYELADSAVIGVALPSAVALTAIALAVLIEPPRVGVVSLLTAPGPGGLLLRRLGLTALVGGPLLGALLLGAAKAIGLVDMPLILALGNVLAVFLALWLLVATAGQLERTHQAVQASRARLHELVEHAPEGIFIADLTGRYMEVNAAGCRLLDLPREQILGKTILDFIPESDAERLWQSQALILKGAVHTAEWKLRRRDGSYVPVEVTTKLLPDGRWQGFVRDITERLELERKLRESRDFLQEVLESSTEYGIIAEDLSRQVVLWNAGARRNYGYERDEIWGRASDVLVAEADIATWKSLHTRGIEQGSAEGTVLAQRKDGSSFATSVVCTRRSGPDNQATGVLIVSRDLTAAQRYLAEQEFLSRVGVELASCLEYGETIARVVELVTSFLGDIAAIDVVKDAGLQRAQVRHRHPDKERLAQAVAAVGAVHGGGHPLQHVIESKAPLLLPHITEEDRKRFATSAEHARVLTAVNSTSAMVVPLIARGQLLAVLSISACDNSRTYGEADLRLALELARRAALALDNAQLFQQLRLQGAVTTNLTEGAVLIRAEDAIIVYANPRFEALFGYAPRELVGRRVEVLNAPDSAPEETAARIMDQLKKSGAWHGELKNVRKDGTVFWSSASVSTFDHEEHGPVWIAVHSDITERKQLEEKNAQSLRDKDVLLKEIHHRVKNNLQVISSLFSLQRERTQNEELRALLDESRTRVQSIALVHEQLYRSSELAAIDLDEYLRELLAAIRSTYGADFVQLEVRAKDVVIEVEQAVPCALLVSELVSNSLKHAFPSGGRGRVWVRAERDEEGYCVLEVGDDGRGIPESLDWTKVQSLGLRLVQSLTRQLRGVIALDRSAGTRFTIRFALAPRSVAAPPRRDEQAAARLAAH